MTLLRLHMLRSCCFSPLPALLSRNLQISKQTGRRLQSPPSVSSQISCPRSTDCARITTTPAGPAHSLNGRNLWMQISHPTCVPVLTQRGRHLHTSAPVRALPAPLVWLVLKPLQKLFAIILGRSIRKWWVSLPGNRRQLIREWAWQRRWHLAAGASVAMVIITLLLLTHLDESPVTGRTRIQVFSRENYMELAALTSESYMEEFAELLVPVADARHQVVERVVQHLVQRNKDISEVSDVSWNVHVVESPKVNAFVLPNGEVFMFTGMLDAVVDVHQLTIILGHEMAHAILGHAAEQASLSHVVDLLSLILLTAIWAVCPRDSLALLVQWVQDKLSELIFSRPYSRKLEAEADQVGLLLAAKACADVRAGPVFWQQIEIREQLRGEPAFPEWLSTHPSHRNRVTQLDRLVPQALELRESCVCPPLPASDPRITFSKSVRSLLQNAKKQAGAVLEEAPKPVSVPTGLPAALLDQSAPPLYSQSRDSAPPVVSETTAVAHPAAPAEEEGSQRVVHI